MGVLMSSSVCMTGLMWLSFTVSDQGSGTSKQSEMTTIDQPRKSTKRGNLQRTLGHDLVLCTYNLQERVWMFIYY